MMVPMLESSSSVDTEKNQDPKLEKVDPWRDVKIIGMGERAFRLAWNKSITGRRVDFIQTDEEGKQTLVWGLEIEIPLYSEDIAGAFAGVMRELDQRGQSFLIDADITWCFEKFNRGRMYSGKYDIPLPPTIRKIRLVDLAPQESLRRKDRNIKSTTNSFNLDADLFNNPIVKKLMGSTQEAAFNSPILQWFMANRTLARRQGAFDELFFDIFAEDKQGIKRFLEILSHNSAPELLVVMAHGGDDALIGEQTSVFEPDAFTSQQIEQNQIVIPQAKGNWLDMRQVLQKYDKPDQFAAILFRSCHTGGKLPPVENVTTVRPIGTVGGYKSIRNFNKVGISVPSAINDIV